MKYNLKDFILLIILYEIIITSENILEPLSDCTKGRISKYSGWENDGQCGFGKHINATGATYIYPVSPNSDLFVSSSHCGVCYEMVGPYGVIRVRVEDYCKKNDESGLCSGDMYHFNLANNGSLYLIGEGELSNITFRMVECGFSGNIRILTNEATDIYYFSFVVLDHNIAVSSVTVQESESETWTELNRDDTNLWTYDPGYEIYFPIKIRIYSINGDYVTVEVKEINDNGIYEADGNFKKPKDTYFNIVTLEKEEIPSSSKNCCEVDKSDFTPIYNSGKVNENYNNKEQNVYVNYISSEIYNGN